MQDAIGACNIVDAQGDSAVVPEIGLGKAALQVPLGAVLIGAAHPVLVWRLGRLGISGRAVGRLLAVPGDGLSSLFSLVWSLPPTSASAEPSRRARRTRGRVGGGPAPGAARGKGPAPAH